MNKKNLALGLATLTFSIASTQTAQAAAINGVTASTTSDTFFGNINNIVNDSGLSTPIGFDSTHAAGASSNVWSASAITPIIDFNLNGSYSLAGFSLWNYNSSNNRGVKDVTIQSSTDGINFTAISGAPTQFAIGNFNAVVSPEKFAFAPVTASYVRFVVSSNHGSAISTGLAEVKFDGSPVATTAVPEPLTILGTLAGLAGGAGLKRRLKADKSKSV
jgi:hypothetical protein